MSTGHWLTQAPQVVHDHRASSSMIGSSAPEAGAYLPGAVAGAVPTLIVHADAIDQLRAGVILRRIGFLPWSELILAAIAGALAVGPQVLVLDEPTSQLDPQGADDVLAALARLNADLGTTVLLAEHRLERAAPLADRAVALLRPGMLVFVDGGTTNEAVIRRLETAVSHFEKFGK